MANGSIITNNGKTIIIDRAYNSATAISVPSEFKVGILNSTPDVGDTELDNPIAITGTEAVDDCEAADWTDDGNTTSATSTNQVKEGTNSLMLEKDGAGAALMSLDKTTTSRDFTSKTLFVWVYITDLTDLVATGTDAIQIRFGSDNANYYRKEWDVNVLTTGWNLLYFTATDADVTTVLAPVIAACDYSYVSFATDLAADLIAANRVYMDDWKVASTDDFTKTFLTGYPTIDTTNHEVEIRCQLLSTEANGYDLDGFALFNTDGTPLMHSEDTFTDESKSNTDQFTFIVKDRLV